MIIGIYGYPDAGKTNFVEQLTGSLVKKGYSVSSVKHTPHEKSIDREGKETWRHWKAGSDPVVFASGIETTPSSTRRHRRTGLRRGSSASTAPMSLSSRDSRMVPS